MELEVIIDQEGNILINRDTEEVIGLLDTLLSQKELEKAEEFFITKPPNSNGEHEYRIFCG